jgi:hypothetical protein
MIIQPYFHLALSVASLDEAMADLASTGVQWRDVLDYPLCVFHGGRTTDVRIRSVYSSGPAPAIELFTAEQGTPLDPLVEGSQFHHIGVWTDAFSADVADLQARGWELVATVADDRGRPSRFALHRTPFGFYLEVVDPRWAGRLLGDLLPEGLRKHAQRAGSGR